MKLYATIRVDMHEHEVLSPPGVLARLRRALGGEPNLATGRMRAAIEATSLVEAHRRALAEVGATDAVALVVDDLVLFEDRDRRPDDLGDMLLAFHEYAPAIAADFRLLRLTVEHREAGLHYVIELQGRTEYPKGEAAVRVIVSARIAALEPRPGETADAYRTRVEPLVHDRVALQVAQASFDSFVARTRDAIARSIPEARAMIVAPIVAPEVRPVRGRERAADDRARRPDDPNYDPHEVHYPNPMLGMFGVAMLGMAFLPPLGGLAGPAEPAAPAEDESDDSPPAEDDASFEGDWW